MDPPTRQQATTLLSELDHELARSHTRSSRPSRLGSVGSDLRASGRSPSPYRTFSPLSRTNETTSEEIALGLLERVRTQKAHFSQQCEMLEERLRDLRLRI